MPDDWFSKKEEVPYLYLSANPWACSCSLNYLHRYLNDYEFNVYVRDGPNIRNDAESVVSNTNNEKDQKLFWFGQIPPFYIPGKNLLHAWVVLLFWMKITVEQPKTFQEPWTNDELGDFSLELVAGA